MKSKILFGISLLFGLMMINSGFNKFFNYMPMPEVPEAAGQFMYAIIQSGWLFALVAVVEIIGGALFICTKTRALGAVVLLPIIVGILLFNIVMAPSGAIMAVVLFVLNIWVIIENRDKYLPMIQPK
ncbi:MAG: DoxX family protein [Bacteroidetes bacterium 4572_77]|nr:MAG: DoxX family protein [Bacteroidetes bacterium 4572_77]